MQINFWVGVVDYGVCLKAYEVKLLEVTSGERGKIRSGAHEITISKMGQARLLAKEVEL